MSSSGQYYAHRLRRSILRFIANKYHFRTISNHKNTRILVVLHLFYMSAWPEIREYLNNLSSYKYSLVVTYMNGFYDEKTLSEILLWKKDTTIVRCDNIGWDVLPFISAIRAIDLSNYDIVFKLQSKGTKRQEIYLYGQYFRRRGWFLNLFEGCIGPFTVHTTIKNLMDRSKRIGLVAARNLIVEDPPHKQHMVNQALNELGLPILENYSFISGTCFAIRADLLEPIKQLDIDINKFNTRGFSFAHRMERIICFPPLWAGLKMSGPNVLIFRRLLWIIHPYAWWWRKYNGARILSDDRINLDDEFAFDQIEPRLIKSWEFINIPIGKIKRKLFPDKKDLVSIAETLPFKYLETRDPKIYQEYCDYNRRVWNNDIMSKERFDSLINSIDVKGYIEEKNIVIKEDNVLLDGQHRCCWLLSRKGPDYVIKALKIYDYHPSMVSRKIGAILNRLSVASQFLLEYIERIIRPNN